MTMQTIGHLCNHVMGKGTPKPTQEMWDLIFLVIDVNHRVEDVMGKVVVVMKIYNCDDYLYYMNLYTSMIRNTIILNNIT